MIKDKCIIMKCPYKCERLLLCSRTLFYSDSTSNVSRKHSLLSLRVFRKTPHAFCHLHDPSPMGYLSNCEPRLIKTLMLSPANRLSLELILQPLPWASVTCEPGQLHVSVGLHPSPQPHSHPTILIHSTGALSGLPVLY